MTTTSFDDWHRTSGGRFSDWLREQCAEDWDAVVRHRFVDELLAGSVSDETMRRYLVQDYCFVDRFTALIGATIASADDLSARLPLCRFLGMFASDENTYFQRAFDALGVSEADRTAPVQADVTTDFQRLMAEAAETRVHAFCLSVLCVAEWSYLSWASRQEGPLPASFVHSEWITLHDNPYFRDFVGWLRGELDRTGAALGPDDQARALDLFRRAVALERRFFDAAYG